MYCNSTLGEFWYFDKSLYNGITGSTAISEEKINMVKASVREPAGVVNLLVQPHNGGHVVLPEVGEVSLWCV